MTWSLGLIDMYAKATPVDYQLTCKKVPTISRRAKKRYPPFDTPQLKA